MSGSDLLAVYRDYLRCLNERQWPRLAEFVADQLSYNGQRMSLRAYRAMLEADVHAIPDLQFHPELLLADDNVVACRLFFQCNPRHAFLGFEPTGTQVSFPEHVFYRFDNRQIVEVWSVIDKQSIREQRRRRCRPSSGLEQRLHEGQGVRLVRILPGARQAAFRNWSPVACACPHVFPPTPARGKSVIRKHADVAQIARMVEGCIFSRRSPSDAYPSDARWKYPCRSLPSGRGFSADTTTS